MNITNFLGLPQALVNACNPNPHNKPDCLSATTLKKGVREIWLEKRHFNEITEDVADMIWALFGTATHELLEHEAPDTFVEEYYEVPMGNWKVTGRVDCYDMKQGIIFDYKTTSVWKVIYKDFSDWNLQGLIYAWLLRKKGLEVKECRFIAMLKDHSKTKAKTDKDYPQKPTFQYSFKVTDESIAAIEDFLQKKVKEVELCKDVPDDELPICTPDERWSEPKIYAVMKGTRKSSLKNFTDKEEAEKYLADGNGDRIQEREGTDKKCTGYCQCRKFCSYYKLKYGEEDD